MAKTIRTILWAGSLAGVLDITGAFILAGRRGSGPRGCCRVLPAGFWERVRTMAGLARWCWEERCIF